MVKYQVKIAKEAKQSLKEYYNWLQENESELVASKFRDGLLQSIESLSERPERNGLLKEMAGSEINCYPTLTRKIHMNFPHAVLTICKILQAQVGIKWKV